MSILGSVLEEENRQGVVFREATTAERGWFRSHPGFVTVTNEQLHFDPDISQGIRIVLGDPVVQMVLSALTFGYWARRNYFQRAAWFLTVEFEEIEKFEIRRRRVRVWIRGKETRFVLSKRADFTDALASATFSKTGRTLQHVS
jgi:hypothetical protein